MRFAYYLLILIGIVMYILTPGWVGWMAYVHQDLGVAVVLAMYLTVVVIGLMPIHLRLTAQAYKDRNN